MKKKVALVTGAMGGLGTAICKAFANDGYQVVAAYHPQFDNKDEWLKEMEAAGYKDSSAFRATCPSSRTARRWSPKPKPRRVPSTSW
jgi:NAD(P)-dependent dehydrogenase (short-subunit alcohol dehydrogenase family)